MIVCDTNVVAGLFLPLDWSEAARALLSKESEWAAPLLWRSEMRNALVNYVRAGRLELDPALSIAEAAQSVVAGREFFVHSASVLRLAVQSQCSAYDCEFVALAMHLGVRLITVDRKLIAAFPDVASKLER